jgi:hypothetical protein
LVELLIGGFDQRVQSANVLFAVQLIAPPAQGGDE